jgi:hypothetical protein
MALRVARGLFRLWLVLSVLWIGGVGVATWWTFPEDYVPPSDRRGANSRTPPEFDPSKPYVVLPDAPKGVTPSQAPQAPEFDPTNIWHLRPARNAAQQFGTPAF